MADEKTLKKQAALNAAYRDTFASPQGQMVLNDIARRYYINRPSFVPGQPDSTGYNEGQRSVVLFINSKINRKQNDELTLLNQLHDEKQYE